MLKFHLDKILEDNNLTINSFTNLLNEENRDSSKNISRKTITAIANNSAKNIQIPVIERILNFFKIPLEALLTLETDELKFKFKLLYKNESNFNSMVSVKQVNFTLPSLYLEIFKENNYLESFHFYINMGFDEEVTTKNKGFVNTITFIPAASLSHKLSDEEKKEFEKRIAENYDEVFDEHLKKISNYIYMLTANDIEDVFKPIIESILNVLKSFYFDDLVISETFYCDISSIIVFPVALNNNGKKLTADFSIFKQLADFPLGVYSDFSKNKTVTTEIEIQKRELVPPPPPPPRLALGGKKFMATFKQYETKKGKFWLYEAYLGINKMTGKPDKVRRRGYKTKKEAQLALSRLQVDYDKNGIKKANNETFKEVYDLWLETYKTTIREATFMKTEIKFRKWILPKYGNLRVNEVTVKKAQQIVNSWAETTDQYKVLHSTSKRIFSYAINLGIIETNPLDNVLMPKRTVTKHKEKVKVYSKEQLVTLFDYLNSKPETYRNDFDKTLLRFLFYSGVRISEALALNWSDIDFQENTVTINKTLSQSKNGYKISDPKTDRSAGVLPLDERTISILKKWQINQRKYMLTLGITDPTMIFCGIYKELITHHAIYARLITICEKAGIPFLGVHVTRHTHASMLLDAGATMVEVQTRLRHTKISQTIDCYGHLAKETKEKTVEKLVQHLNID